MWRVSFCWDYKQDDVIHFDTIEATDPDDVMRKLFSSEWYCSASDGGLKRYCYRMKDAHVTVYVDEVNND